MSDAALLLGQTFPPRSAAEIAAYDLVDVLQGYQEHAPDEAIPGENHSAGYRWGCANRQRDRSGQPDGFDHLRHAAIAASARS